MLLRADTQQLLCRHAVGRGAGEPACFPVQYAPGLERYGEGRGAKAAGGCWQLRSESPGRQQPWQATITSVVLAECGGETGTAFVAPQTLACPALPGCTSWRFKHS